jgi:hypothetical protein
MRQWRGGYFVSIFWGVLGMSGLSTEASREYWDIRLAEWPDSDLLKEAFVQFVTNAIANDARPCMKTFRDAHFKGNANFISALKRWYVSGHPEHAELFTFKGYGKGGNRFPDPDLSLYF